MVGAGGAAGAGVGVGVGEDGRAGAGAGWPVGCEVHPVANTEMTTRLASQYADVLRISNLYLTVAICPRTRMRGKGKNEW
jgi:hypothetical protein